MENAPRRLDEQKNSRPPADVEEEEERTPIEEQSRIVKAVRWERGVSYESLAPRRAHNIHREGEGRGDKRKETMSKERKKMI